MKELSIEEKAKRYDEAIERAEKIHNKHKAQPFDVMLKVFPELKESEDERIRKEIIATIHLYYGEPLEDEAKEMIDWLEKQGEQKFPIEKLPSEIKTIGESLGFTTQEDCDRYNQMVTDLIMSDDDKGEQKSAWSEEDEERLSDAIFFVREYQIPTKDKRLLNAAKETEDWLKSLKYRYTWKPSEKQMQALSNAGNSFKPFEEGHKVLWSLYNDLKKLREK